MKKLIALLVSLALVASFAFMISGCSSSNPEVTVSAPVGQPAGLTIRGTVYVGYAGAPLPILGTPTRYKGTPLAGVSLFLSGNRGIWAATTDSNGQFAFTNLPQTAQQPSELLGQGPGFTIVASMDGYQRTMVENIQLAGSSALPSNSEITVDFSMRTNPVVLLLSPSVGTTIESGAATFTVNFNEPMDTASVNPIVVAQGLRTYAAGDNQNVTRTWSNGDKTLAIAASNLLPNQVYQLVLDPYDANGNYQAKDKAGNVLDQLVASSDDLIDLDSGSGGLSVWVYNSTTDPTLNPIANADPTRLYRTAAGGVPGAPSDVQVSLNGKQPVNTPGGANYTDVHTGTPPDGAVRVYWAPASGQVTGYRVYVAPSMSGPWANASGDIVGVPAWNDLVSTVNQAFFGVALPTTPVNPNVDPVYWNKWAFVNNKVYFKVVAFNGEGEGAAATAEAQEKIGPIFTTTAYRQASWGTTTLLGNGYWLPAITTPTVAYVGFSEPVDTVSAGTASNYLVTGGTVTAAEVLTSSSAPITAFGGTPYTIVKITSSVNFTGAESITANVGGVKDLAGNTVAAGTLPVPVP